jgi:hypothetical protein
MLGEIVLNDLDWCNTMAPSPETPYGSGRLLLPSMDSEKPVGGLAGNEGLT